PVRIGQDAAHSTPVDAPDLPKPNQQYVSTLGPVLPRLYSGRHEYHYRQTILTSDDPSRTPARDSNLYTGPLKNQGVPGLAEWTSALLRRLAAQPSYGLSPSDIGFDVKPSGAHEGMGRALAAYLAHSGE